MIHSPCACGNWLGRLGLVEGGGGMRRVVAGVLARTTVAVAFISTGGFYRGPVVYFGRQC